MLKRSFVFGIAAFCLAGPALAQDDGDLIARDIQRSIPHPAEIEAIAPVVDRMTGALLDVEVGPMIDAVDPYHRRPGYGRPGRTLGALAARDDPYFEDRLGDSIYSSSENLGRVMGAFGAAAPALARSLRQFQAAIGAAVADYRHDAYSDPRGEEYRDD